MSQLRLPFLIAVCILCFVVGAAAGAGALLGLGFRQPPKPIEIKVVEKEGAEKKAKFRREKFRRAYLRYQLVALVKRLDLLTSAAPPLKLSGEESAKLAEELRDLDKVDELKPEDYKTRYANIIAVLKEHEELLQSAGFRLPGEKFQWPPESPNPFVDGENQQRLESLRKRFPNKT